MTDKRHRSFGVKKTSDFAPLTFDLGGEEFTCRPAIQGSVVMLFLYDMQRVEGINTAPIVFNFFREAMEPSEYERFDAFLKNPEMIVEMETIASIATYLVEEYLKRPTQPESSSQSGQST